MKHRNKLVFVPGKLFHPSLIFVGKSSRILLGLRLSKLWPCPPILD